MSLHPLKPDAVAMPPTLALRPTQAARALGVSERTLWGLTHAGDPARRVPHVKLGRSTLYPVRELSGWLSAQIKPHEAGEAQGGGR